MIRKKNHKLGMASRSIAGVALATGLAFAPQSMADPFPPFWNGGAGGALHHAPVMWPSEPQDPADCGDTCGEWKPYTRFQSTLNDPRVKDPSNGGTSPQNYVNIASSCIDKALPSIYYNLKKVDENDPSQDVIMFRWRVEQIANTYATGPNPGTYGATHPWNSALWTVLFDVDGSGYRDLAAHLNGNSGSPSSPIDMLAGIYGKIPTQSINYGDDPDIHLLGHNPTAFVDDGTNRILNFQNSVAPTSNWPNGSAETSWDYGTSRAIKVSTRACTEYFVDYQIPVAMLDAEEHGGPKVDRSTPLSMLFCTANSLNNPFQKDCALNRAWIADPNKPGPFGDYISFDQEEPYSQPIIREVKAEAPGTCGQDYTLNASVQDTLAVTDGVVHESVREVSFWYYHDVNGDGISNDGSLWTHAASATLVPGTLNQWRASWNSSNLPKGRYLIGVQAVDDNTLVDDDMVPTGVDNRTFSYVTSNAMGELYVDGQWATGEDGNGNPINLPQDFPAHSNGMSPSGAENWFGNPAITGIQVATAGVDLAVNACGISPSIEKTANPTNVAAGAGVTFTITVANPANNSGAITVNSISDALPIGFGFVSTGAGSIDTFTSEPTNGATGTLNWSFNPVSIAAGSSATLEFTAQASSTAGTYSNIASAQTSFGSIESPPVAVGVDSARISLTKTPNKYSVAVTGDETQRELRYTFDYANDSSVAVTAAMIEDSLPAGATYVACSGGTSCTADSGTVTWQLGTLAGGATGSVTLTMRVNDDYSTTALTNTGTMTVTAPDGTAVVKTAASTVAVTGLTIPGSPAFTLEKTAGAVSIAPGGSVTWTIRYTNYGTAEASGVEVTDILPAGFSYSSCTGACAVSAGTVTWSIGTVAAGASGSVTLTAAAADPFTAVNPAVNTASIDWVDSDAPVTATNNVGVTGSACNDYYFLDGPADVGFDGAGKKTAQITPIPTAASAGSYVIVTAPPKSGGVFAEAVRFYQDPESSTDVPFDGDLTTTVFIDRANGPAMNFRASVYDYDSVTGQTSLLGTSDTSFGGNTKGALAATVGLTGALAKDHRLLWVYEVQSDHNNGEFNVQFQWGGTVANTISGGTTAALSKATFCTVPPANLTLSKTVSESSITEGATPTLTYTLAHANTGEVDATNASIVDTLPTGFTNCQFSTNNADWAACSGVGSSPQTHTFNLGTFNGGANSTVYVRGTVPAGTTAGQNLINTASISSDQTSMVMDTATTTVTAAGGGGGSPALALALSTDKTAANPGDTVTYTVTVVNTGGADAANVVVSNAVPTQGSYYTFGTCSDACTGVGTISWPAVASMAPGASRTYTYTMVVAAAGLPAGVTVIPDTVQALADGIASFDSNEVNVTLNGNPVLALTKSVDRATAAPGDTLTYTLTLTNTGSATASNVLVTDAIIANSGYKPGTLSVDNVPKTDTADADGASFDAINNAVRFKADTLAAGASLSYRFQTTVVSPFGSSGDTVLLNTAIATAGNAPQVDSQASTTVAAAPDIALTKSGPDAVAYPATTLTAAISDSTTLFVSSTAGLEVGQYIKVGSTVARIVSLGATSLATDSPLGGAVADAVIPAVTFGINYRNIGNAGATNVVVTDTLPAGFGYHSANPAAATDPGPGNAGDVVWNLGDIGAGANGNLELIAFPTGTTGNLTNTVTATLAETDSDPGNNTASATVAVGGLTVHKSTSTPVLSAGAVAQYSITLSNSLSDPITGVSVADPLPPGFTYKTDTGLVGGGALNPGGTSDEPVWSGLTVPANGTLVITFDADVSADVGAATWQNEVVVTAPAGIGITPFDPLSTTDEDVTILGPGTGMVEGRVYFDRDDDGAYDPGKDTPLDGSTVNIVGADGFVYVVYTDSDGYYSRVLPAGITTVAAASQPGYVVRSGSANPGAVSVVQGAAVRFDVPFVATSNTGSISGKVWSDDNGNQVIDVGEAAYAGVTVQLLDGVDAVIQAVLSNVDGSYSFTGLADGAYGVRIVVPSGQEATTANPRVNVTVSGGGSIANENFGLRAATTVFYTVNYDGNGHTAGSAPVDNDSPYAAGAEVTAMAPGDLARHGHGFAGWNTQADGNGTAYAANATFTMGSADLILYARWTPFPDVHTTIEGPATVKTGDITSVLIIFGNQGADNATSVTYTATLPSGLAAVNCAGAVCDYNSANGVLTLSGLPEILIPDQHTHILVSFPAPDGEASLVVQSTIATTTVGDPTGNNEAIATVLVDASVVDVATWLEVPPQASAGAVVNGAAYFTNLGGDPGNSATYALAGLPVGALVTHGDQACTVDGATAVLSGCGLPDTLQPGQVVELAIAYTAPADGSVTLTATVDAAADNDAANNTASGTTVVVASATPDVYSTVAAPATAVGGSTVEVFVRYGNLGPATASDVSYRLTTLPDAAVVSQGTQSCTVTTDVLSGCNLSSTLAAGQMVDLTVRYTAPASGTASVASNVSATGEIHTANNPAAASTEITPAATYNVTYHGNGNSDGTAPVDAGGPYPMNASVSVLGTGTLERTGHTFGGWNTQASGDGVAYNASDVFSMPAADVDLYAQWTPVQYAMVYHGNGNTSGTAPVDGSSPYYMNAVVTVFGAGTLERMDHTFAGWNTQADGDGTPYAAGGALTMPAADVALHAQWSMSPPPPPPPPPPPTYAVTYDGNGHTDGAVPIDASAYEAGETVTTLDNDANLQRSGHSFTGWNTQADGHGSAYAVGATFSMPAAHVTLYAQWADVALVRISGIVFHDNGSGGGTAGDGTRNGDEPGTNAGGLNAVIVDGSSTVLAAEAVASNGTWAAYVAPGTGYAAYITTDSPLTGSTVTPAALLPSGWIVTGESDATPDGVRTGIDAADDVDSLAFGIRSLPADVHTSVTASESVQVGETITVQFTFGNQGLTSAEGLEYKMMLSPGLSGVQCEGDGSGCIYDAEYGRLTRSGLPGSLAPDQMVEVVVRYTAPAQAIAGAWSEITTTTPEVTIENNTAGAQTRIAGTAVGQLHVAKTAYLGHDDGATCPGTKELVYVNKERIPVDITWCFVATNHGDTWLSAPVFSDAGLDVTPGNQAGMSLRSGSFPLAPGATAVWYYEDRRDHSLVNYVSLAMTVVDEIGAVIPDAPPAVGEDTVAAIFGYVFDPPFGVKTGTQGDQDVVRWTMVWVNDNVIRADGVVITDPPPEGMTMFGTPTCTAHGTTTVDLCTFDAPDGAFPRGRVRVLANFGPDFGVTLGTINEAPNRLEIAFDVLVDRPEEARSYDNQAHAQWTPPPTPDDQSPDPLEALTYDAAQLADLDPDTPPSLVNPQDVPPIGSSVPFVPPTNPPPPAQVTPIPVNSPLGLLMAILGIGLLAARMRRQRTVR